MHSSLGPNLKKTSGLRGWLAIDERAGAIAYTQTPRGRALLLFSAVAVCLLFSSFSHGFFNYTPYILLAGLSSYFNRHKNIVLLLSGLGVFFYMKIPFLLEKRYLSLASVTHADMPYSYKALVVATLAVTVFFAILLLCARRKPDQYLARHPMVSLLALSFIIYYLSTWSIFSHTTRVSLWYFLLMFVYGIWYMAYALVDQRNQAASPILFQLSTVHTLWMASSVPWGKGAAFLRKNASTTKEALAITQLKGFKLLIWGILLLLAEFVLSWIFYKTLGLTDLATLQKMHANGQVFPRSAAWYALIWATAKNAIALAGSGHIMIAAARLAGFRLPRNTCRPLQARTLIEYWNRFYFYFKELLVDFFFLPTFFRCFKKHPKIRLFFATFMAAGVGNAIFHFVRDINLEAGNGLLNDFIDYQSYLFYCTVLATGIGISQLRFNRGITPSNTALGRVWSFICIWGFVGGLYIFGVDERTYSLMERLSFMANLLGLNTLF